MKLVSPIFFTYVNFLKISVAKNLVELKVSKTKNL